VIFYQISLNIFIIESSIFHLIYSLYHSYLSFFIFDQPPSLISLISPILIFKINFFFFFFLYFPSNFRKYRFVERERAYDIFSLQFIVWLVFCDWGERWDGGMVRGWKGGIKFKHTISHKLHLSLLFMISLDKNDKYHQSSKSTLHHEVLKDILEILYLIDPLHLWNSPKKSEELSILNFKITILSTASFWPDPYLPPFWKASEWLYDEGY